MHTSFSRSTRIIHVTSPETWSNSSVHAWVCLAHISSDNIPNLLHRTTEFTACDTGRQRVIANGYLLVHELVGKVVGTVDQYWACNGEMTLEDGISPVGHYVMQMGHHRLPRDVRRVKTSTRYRYLPSGHSSHKDSYRMRFRQRWQKSR
jgi:hypothetical protein